MRELLGKDESARSMDTMRSYLEPGIDSAEAQRVRLRELGKTVDWFKALPLYRNALASGKYPWLSDL